MTEAMIERVTVEGDGLTVSLIVWRRFRRPMPGLVEAIYAANRELAESGPYLPFGTQFDMPVPIPRQTERQEPIRLW